jgi:hypothetical protein
MALCSIGPRQVIAWSRPSRKNSIDMTRMPSWTSSGRIFRSADTIGLPCTPIMRGIE